jgi:hypothetical protein
MSYHFFSHNVSSHSAVTRTRLALLLAVFSIPLLSTSLLYAEETSTETETTTQQIVTTNTPDGDPAVQTTTGGETSESYESATIVTGDAESTSDFTTEQNNTNTTIEGGTETDVVIENTAIARTTAEILSETGDNTALAQDDAHIKSGNAISTANVLNVVNTNIFNAQGLMYFLNMLMGNVALDLRDLFSILTGNTVAQNMGTSCSLEDGTCDDANTSLNISNQNVATIENDLTVGATTGGSDASALRGDASVTSGDAFAGANIMNVVNTNITNANYLLLTMNGFGGGSGDIIFPGADWFYELLGGGSSIPAGSSVSFSNDNTATIENIGQTVADTGLNSANGTDASIDSGNANASTNIYNQANTNIFGDSISLLFRVSDSWKGSVYGLPDGMSWRETPAGIEIFWDTFSGPSAPLSTVQNLSVANANTANITNRFNVFALTGENSADAGDEASVTSGNADASTNIVNIVNTNVLGRNWVLAIFNILGDWEGDISFGQSDLWVGARAITPSTVRAGTCFPYELTVNNFGDAYVDNVYITARFNTLLQRIEGMVEDAEGKLRYHVGRIPAGASKTITLPACLTDQVGPGTSVDTEFEVDGAGADVDNTNNTDMISVVSSIFGGSGGMLRGTAETNTNFSITKVASSKTVSASSSVDYTITITNTGDPIYNALLLDTIYDESGKAIHEQRWSLEKVEEEETIIITYSVFFSASTTPGTYTNKVFLSGSTQEALDSAPVKSPIASVPVRVTAYVPTDVAVQNALACEPILTKYIRFGENNDSEQVSKLQYFLRIVEEQAQVPLTGLYDRTTYDAVHTLQRKYASDILTPWGVTDTTGYVYYTTQKKINELWCDREFPLTPEQQREIERVRATLENAENTGSPLPRSVYETIGVAPATQPEDTLLASSDAPATTEEVLEQVTEEAQNQVAAVGGLWNSIREKTASLFSFFAR